MKNWLVLLLALPLFAMATDQDEIDVCLSNWKDHPFKGHSNDFRTISAKVKIMGIGGELKDDAKSEQPELILVKPTVNVMSKQVVKLLNPNGWYCLKSSVAVLGKTQIELGCGAKFTASNTGATVLGSGDEDSGVTVLGKSEITREKCSQ
ncbi:MAG: hypothetical protein AB7F86_19015 [Bdellovibrionales bacterium]